MLSLKQGTPLAIIDGDKDKKIFYKEAKRDDEPEIDTTQEQKEKILKSYFGRNQKLQKKDIDALMQAFRNGEILEDKKLNKILEQGHDYLTKSLKRYLHFGDETNLMPLITDPSFRIFCSGTSGSGKSWFISELVKVNKPRGKGGVFMFSPFEDDTSIKIKNLIHIKLENYQDEYNKEFELEDLPDGSICIFDDCETYKKQYRDLYLELRDTLMERGRHPAPGGKYGISTINISHNPLQGVKSKVVLRDSMYYICFPRYNPRDARVLLTTYASLSKDAIDEIMNTDSRWIFVRKSVPRHFIGQHEIGLL